MQVLVTENEKEGLLALMGKSVTFFCLNYIYVGTLIGVNDTCVKIDNARIVYETGELSSKNWKDAQKLPNSWYIQTSAIESFGELKE